MKFDPILLVIFGVPLMFITLSFIPDPDTRFMLIGVWIAFCGIVAMIGDSWEELSGRKK